LIGASGNSHRVYTPSHIDYVVEAILQVNVRRNSIPGYRIISQPNSCGTLPHASNQLKN